MSDTERQLLYSTFFRNEQSLINWLAFCLSQKISPANRRLLISCCSNPTEILDVTADYRGENQPDVKLVKHLEDLKKQCYPEQLKRDIGKCLEWLVVDGQGLLVPGFPDYPSLLMEVPDKPLLLFYKGNTDLLHLPMVAIVGSRRPTVDGRRIARHFAIQLAQSGLGICSGLALGIDACSHEGALSVGGNTVAVLGTGTDRCYPEANRGLYERIGEQGVMISEFLPGTPPQGGEFSQAQQDNQRACPRDPCCGGWREERIHDNCKASTGAGQRGLRHSRLYSKSHVQGLPSPDQAGSKTYRGNLGYH